MNGSSDALEQENNREAATDVVNGGEYQRYFHLGQRGVESVLAGAAPPASAQPGGRKPSIDAFSAALYTPKSTL